MKTTVFCFLLVQLQQGQHTRCFFPLVKTNHWHIQNCHTITLYYCEAILGQNENYYNIGLGGYN